MSTKIFFSWQSDWPTTEGRNLIERALAKAITRLSMDIELQEAVRDEIQLDKDTLDVPGSPNIFATIREKISNATLLLPTSRLSAPGQMASPFRIRTS